MPRHKTFDKQEIVHNAMHLFWEKGFYQTSIQELVKELGINRASLYDSFHDKEHLFIQSFIMYREEFIITIKEIIKSEKNIKKAFIVFFDYLNNAYKQGNIKKGCFICNTYAELLPTENDTIIDLLQDTQSIIVDLIYQTLKKAQKNNELKPKINLKLRSESIYTTMVGAAILSKTSIKKDFQNKSLNNHLLIFN